ncbi:MAG: NUDIX hydrolase [Acidobacteriota bacterium]
MRNWRRDSSQRVFECRVFTVRCDSNCSPSTNTTHEFFVIEPANWVNVIAITDIGEVVLIRQYRHGMSTVTLEIPGGMIDPEESAEIAARRELREETGYEAESWRLLGICDPNPALQNNRCYTFLAEQARPVAEQKLDHTEEIEVLLLPLKDIANLITDGRITHALVITAFYYLELFRQDIAASL